MNKDIKEFVIYYMKCVGISIIPIIIVCMFVYGQVSEIVIWIIVAVVMLACVLLGMLYRPKYLKKKEQKRKNDIDPFK